jgi:nitrogen regulatory protein PII
MEARVIHALHDLPEFPGFFVSEVRGQGRGYGSGGSYEATESDLTYLRFLQIQLVCRADAAETVRQKIAEAAWTGRKGDGVIFSTEAGSFLRIRQAIGQPDGHQQ